MLVTKNAAEDVKYKFTATPAESSRSACGAMLGAKLAKNLGDITTISNDHGSFTVN